jgi:sugar O-acyltransferase (sialic acid O-acetyltransferase NeuD family)
VRQQSQSGEQRHRRVVIIGAGGHAREVEWLTRSASTAALSFSVLGFVVSDLDRRGPADSPALGDFQWLREHRDQYDALALGIGSPSARLRIMEELLPEFGEEWWPPLVHPSVQMDQTTCRIGPGAMLAAGCVITVNVTLGPFSMANFGCTIGHEAVVGFGSLVNPGANVSGGVRIGRGVLIGTGAQLLQYTSVGDLAVVGAGAVVIRDVRPGCTVVGVPARELVTACNSGIGS